MVVATTHTVDPAFSVFLQLWVNTESIMRRYAPYGAAVPARRGEECGVHMIDHWKRSLKGLAF